MHLSPFGNLVTRCAQVREEMLVQQIAILLLASSAICTNPNPAYDELLILGLLKAIRVVSKPIKKPDDQFIGIYAVKFHFDMNPPSK